MCQHHLLLLFLLLIPLLHISISQLHLRLIVAVKCSGKVAVQEYNMESATPELHDAVVINTHDNSTTTNTELQLTVVHNGDPTNTIPSLTRVASPTNRKPSLDFLQNSRDAMMIFLGQCVPLYKYALEGNWQAAKDMMDANQALKTAAIASGWPTVLHVAAGTNNYHFMAELLKYLDNEATELQDEKGNTAFCFAAAAGNWRIAELMLEKNPRLPRIRGGDGMTPLQFAALQGRCPMACKLYRITKDIFNNEDWELLFFTCLKTSNYHLALKMASDRTELAFARDGDNGIALHLLAQKQKPFHSCCHCQEHQHQISVKINPGMKQHVYLQLVNFLWITILDNIDSRQDIIDIISQPSQLLLDAAKVGNFGFLSELISAYPFLIWEVDSENRSIIHTAVLYRHANIYNLIHEIGSIKDIIVTFVGTHDENTLLHLAAKLAPPSQLESVLGAAFQMSIEISWFKEVKKMMHPSLRCVTNSEGFTAQELFTSEHTQLRKNAEDWMKHTAEHCMLISTVIATGVFFTAIGILTGLKDETKEPNYLGKTSFLIFVTSDATTVILAVTAILIFLSILTSRYAENDFHKSLPSKMVAGLITLFISISSMMVAFSCSFFIIYNSCLMWVPIFISVFACLPIIVFIVLQFSLWLDIIYSTYYYCRYLFKPRKCMLYVVERR